MRVGIIGRFAYGKDLLDGQTIKTRILREALMEKMPESKISFVDVYRFKLRFILVFIKIFILFARNEKIIVLLSKNGRRIIFPYMCFLNKIFKRKMYHDVIGGRLADDLKTNPKRKKIFLSFSEHWVEMEKMKIQLIEYGVENVDVIPNFKMLKPIDKNNLYSSDKLTFCTFSRVTKSKGISIAIETIAKLNKNKGCFATLDIYGEIEKGYLEEFNELLEKYQNFVFYKGKVPYDQSVETIKNYYMLLFPTTYEGEGFPGTIIDTFFAGVPVIATDWKYNSDILTNDYTGIIYDYKKENAFYEALVYCVENQEKINNMRINCLEEAKKYSVDELMNVIINKLKG